MPARPGLGHFFLVQFLLAFRLVAVACPWPSQQPACPEALCGAPDVGRLNSSVSHAAVASRYRSYARLLDRRRRSCSRTSDKRVIIAPISLPISKEDAIEIEIDAQTNVVLHHGQAS